MRNLEAIFETFLPPGWTDRSATQLIRHGSYITSCGKRRRYRCFRCYYNFIRPHRALKFGCEVRTPAMQAGLTRRQLVFREIFEAGITFLPSQNVVFVLFDSAPSVTVTARRMPLAA